MTGAQFKEGRLKSGLTQQEAALRLRLSQPYLSQLEQGQRPVSAELARLATAVYHLRPTALPVPEAAPEETAFDPGRMSRRLSSLGYPGFEHLRGQKANPATVVLEALLQDDLEVRLMEALPWVLLNYPDLDWIWLVRHAKLHDVQNRLGFLVALALELAANRDGLEHARAQLSSIDEQLERARLAREDTLCRESMPAAERSWLKKHRSSLARHWNLLTGLTTRQLSYAS